jgi:hypothetical protein
MDRSFVLNHHCIKFFFENCSMSTTDLVTAVVIPATAMVILSMAIPVPATAMVIPATARVVLATARVILTTAMINNCHGDGHSGYGKGDSDDGNDQ